MNRLDKHNQVHHHNPTNAAVDSPKTIDPVCGMTVQLNAGKPNYVHNGETYHFCAQRCHDKFANEPEHFLTGAHKQQPASLPEGTKYTCPMHPEIISDKPEDCPKCGMALEPMGIPSGDEGPNPELVDFKRRFWIGAVLTAPLLVLTVGPFVGLGFVREILGERTTFWLELILGTPVILWAGWPFSCVASSL